MTVSPPSPDPAPRVQLLWIPLGAGASPVVRRSGQLYELLAAHRDHRETRSLFHAALLVRLGATYSVEMGPAWRGNAHAGAASQGPVGSRLLGSLRLFRYEISCSSTRPIPDAVFAVGGPIPVETDVLRARRLLEAVPSVPKLVWGRDEIAAGEMWNSNSVIAWLLDRSGHSPEPDGLPPGGRAPGWAAGQFMSARDSAARPG